MKKHPVPAMHGTSFTDFVHFARASHVHTAYPVQCNSKKNDNEWRRVVQSSTRSFFQVRWVASVSRILQGTVVLTSCDRPYVQLVTESAPKSAVTDTSVNVTQSEATPVPAATASPKQAPATPKAKGKGKGKKGTAQKGKGKAQAEGGEAAAHPSPPQRPAVDLEKLKQLKAKLGDVASRTGGKGTVRRKFKGQRKVSFCSTYHCFARLR